MTLPGDKDCDLFVLGDQTNGQAAAKWLRGRTDGGLDQVHLDTQWPIRPSHILAGDFGLTSGLDALKATALGTDYVEARDVLDLVVWGSDGNVRLFAVDSEGRKEQKVAYEDESYWGRWDLALSGNFAADLRSDIISYRREGPWSEPGTPIEDTLLRTCVGEGEFDARRRALDWGTIWTHGAVGYFDD